MSPPEHKFSQIPATVFERVELSEDQFETMTSNQMETQNKPYILEQFNIKPIPRQAVARENNLTGGLKNESQESSEETNANPSGLGTQEKEDSILSPRSHK